MKNNDIRAEAAKANVKLWQVAEELDIWESKLSRILRHELPSEQKDRIKAIIAKIQSKVEL